MLPYFKTSLPVRFNLLDSVVPLYFFIYILIMYAFPKMVVLLFDPNIF
jgi:hypothetical protein